MTLEQVMALDGRELDFAVAERIDWKGEPWKFSPIDGMPFDRPFPAPAPEFHKSWSAAMQIRDWARGLEYRKQTQFVSGLVHVTERRRNISGERLSMWACLLLSECPDYARAALLVSVEE